MCWNSHENKNQKKWNSFKFHFLSQIISHNPYPKSEEYEAENRIKITSGKRDIIAHKHIHTRQTKNLLIEINLKLDSKVKYIVYYASVSLQL